MLAHLIITQATKACGWGRIAYTRYAHLSNRRGEQKKRKLVKKSSNSLTKVEAFSQYLLSKMINFLVLILTSVLQQCQLLRNQTPTVFIVFFDNFNQVIHFI